MAKATEATKKALNHFHEGFKKAMVDDAKELADAPKVHDHAKGEYIREVDPKDADKFLND